MKVYIYLDTARCINCTWKQFIHSVHRLTLRFPLSFAATRQNSEDDLALQPPRDTWSRYKSKTCDFSRNLVNAEVALVQAGELRLVPPLGGISSERPGSPLASLGRRAWPPDPAELPSGCAVPSRPGRLQLALSVVLRGVATAAAVAGWVDLCLRCVPVGLPVGDQQQPVQQVVVSTSDKEAAGSPLPDLQARAETERNIFEAFFSPQRVPFQVCWKGGWPV